jgi:hypothetical protein
MIASLPARLALIAALVFSQALYAGHSVNHDAGSQPDCMICLQSANSAAVTCDGIQPTVDVYGPVCPESHIALVLPAYFPLNHPSRAPPQFPL